MLCLFCLLEQDRWQHRSALPLFKVSIKHPVWETLTANADAFQDTITAELMQDKESIHFTYRGETQINSSIGLNLHFTKGTEKCEASSYEKATLWVNVNNIDTIQIHSWRLASKYWNHIVQIYWGFKKAFFSIPGVFDSLGIMHRTKWGAVDFRLVISLFKFSWNRHTKTHWALMALNFYHLFIWFLG